MFSLAALRFRTVMATAGGPIEKIELADVSVGGRHRFLANAYLREAVLPRPTRQVFGNAAGTGMAASPLVARHKAIAEAMERWAYAAVHREGIGRRYGFDVDPSTTGMAAFPGVWARAARPAAWAEASERFTLLSWWEGHLAAFELAATRPDLSEALLISDAPGVTALVWSRMPEGHYAYGFAGAATWREARLRALDEMERHHLVLKVRALVWIGQERSDSDVLDVLERRSLFFATDEGHALFLERLRGGAPRSRIAMRPVFDGAIPGPWAKYAPVWRVALQPPSERFASSDPRYFFW